MGLITGATLGATLQTVYTISHPDTWYFFVPVYWYALSVGMFGFMGTLGGVASATTLHLAWRLSSVSVCFLRILASLIVTWALSMCVGGGAFSLEMAGWIMALVLPQVLLAARTLVVAKKKP
ncbi:hypothetical protein [Microbacterium sp.]|uniref:hypothetical protein n=1 Tax=Microbacterium sp. TaxID=51671 RepID=UPI0039E6C267